MTDNEKKREDVILELETCLTSSCRGFEPGVYCPFTDDVWDSVRDAITLLKAQDAREKEWVSYKRIGECVKTDIRCACGNAVMQDTIQFEDGATANTLFCTNCGLMMRSPGSDKDGKWLKENWKRTLGDLFREAHMVIMDHKTDGGEPWE